MGGKACIKIATPERCSKNRIIQRRCMKSCGACRKLIFIQYLKSKKFFISYSQMHLTFFSNVAEPPASQQKTIAFPPSNNERKYFIK